MIQNCVNEFDAYEQQLPKLKFVDSTYLKVKSGFGGHRVLLPQISQICLGRPSLNQQVHQRNYWDGTAFLKQQEF